MVHVLHRSGKLCLQAMGDEWHESRTVPILLQGGAMAKCQTYVKCSCVTGQIPSVHVGENT